MELLWQIMILTILMSVFWYGGYEYSLLQKTEQIQSYVWVFMDIDTDTTIVSKDSVDTLRNRNKDWEINVLDPQWTYNGQSLTDMDLWTLSEVAKHKFYFRKSWTGAVYLNP